uniref:pilus assembly protein PilP n=1 Tax=Aquabacterium sp. TaxID=1872578 RepID=UPI0025BC39CB
MNIKTLILLLSIVAIFGCDKNADLQIYVAQVKARPAQPIEPLPTITPYEPIPFLAKNMRNPFIDPKPEQGQAINKPKAKCAQPDINRPKEELEQYSLDNLQMKGTLADERGLWGLVLAPGGIVYRVTLGQYMGLNHGKIAKVTKDDIDVIEM